MADTFALTYTFADHDGSLRAGARPAHRSFLDGERDAGRLLLAGPLGDDMPHGALLIIRAASKSDAAAWAARDPYAHAGAVAQVRVEPLRISRVASDALEQLAAQPKS